MSSTSQRSEGAIRVWSQPTRDGHRSGCATRQILGLLHTGAGLVAGVIIAWLAIRLGGMGNGGDTGIVRFEILDFVQASALGIGVVLLAAASEAARAQIAGAFGLTDRRRPSRATGFTNK